MDQQTGGAAGEQPDDASFQAHQQQQQQQHMPTSNMALVMDFLQSYGWFILVAVIVAYYIKKKVEQNSGRPAPNQEGLQYDADTAFRRQEAMERVRMKWQEEHDKNAVLQEEKRRQREEQKRQERIEDWDRHQEGKGYRSKVYKPKEDESETVAQPRPKPKKPLRSPDYNPLTGEGPSCAWRPGRPRGGGGG